MLRVSAVLLLALAALLALMVAVEAMPQAKGANGASEPPVLGANKCTWGPAYWCANHDNAKECSTTSWCVEKKMLAAQ